MDVEDILNRHKELVERKFREYNGLLSQETAAYLVAQEMGLDVEEENTPELKVSHLVPGMRRVRLSGKVLAVGPLEGYTRKDGSTGQAQRLLLRDESDRVELMLWEPPKEELRAGDLLKISGGYVKNAEEGLQLNVSERGTVEILGFEPLHLTEAIDEAEGLTIKAPVLRVNPDKLFQSKRGGVFRASSLTLFQDAVRARVIFWEEEAEKPNGLRPFQEIELTDLRASLNDSGLLELMASPATSITARGKVEPLQIDVMTPSEILHPELDVDLQGKVSSISREPEQITITLADEKAELRLIVIHQELISHLSMTTPGNRLFARGMDIVHTPSGQLEIRSTIWSEFSQQ